MTTLTLSAGVVAMLGAALIGGVFFTFSSFVMKALANVPSAQGIAAMQSINVVVLNPSFLGAFMGTAALSLVMIVVSVMNWGAPPAPYFLAGAVSYLCGTFFVTAFGNVPLNDQLAAVAATGHDAIKVWKHYLVRWTTLNTVRTIAALGASLLFTVGLLQNGG